MNINSIYLGHIYNCLFMQLTKPMQYQRYSVWDTGQEIHCMLTSNIRMKENGDLSD